MRRTDQRRDAVFACYQHDVTGHPIAELVDRSKPFTRDLAEGVSEHRAELDRAIAESLVEGWSLSRLAPLDLNIMRVALYEIGKRDDIPIEVSIDEAVELAKLYCGADAPSFVNGVLATAAGKLAVSGVGDE